MISIEKPRSWSLAVANSRAPCTPSLKLESADTLGKLTYSDKASIGFSRILSWLGTSPLAFWQSGTKSRHTACVTVGIQFFSLNRGE